MAVDKIKFKRSFTSGYVPSIGDLDAGELVLNIADKQIFTADENGSIVSIGGAGGGAGLPVGAITAFPTRNLPNGFLLCDGSVFSQLDYPDLYKALGDSNILPDLREKYIKGVGDSLSPLTTVPWQLPDHTHSTDITHNHTASQASHNHSRGTMEISGRIGTRDNNNKITRMLNDPTGAFYTEQGGTTAARSGTYTAPVVNAGGFAAFAASRNWTGLTSVATPAVTVQEFQDSRVSSGVREALNLGSSVEVDHVSVVFAIKAAGYVTNEGLAAVDGMRAQLEAMEQQQNEFNGSMIGSEQQFPPLAVGKTPGEMWVPKDGSLQLRTTYPALWAWAQDSGIVVTEDKWQELKGRSHGGAVGVYSSGDGSTTFRVPAIGQYGMVQRPIPNGLNITEAHFIGYADQNKSHTHAATQAAHNHSGTTAGAGGHDHTLTGGYQGGYTNNYVNADAAGGSHSNRIKTSSVGNHTHNLSTNSATPAITVGAEGGSEVTMKHMWCTIWIYSGNSLTLLPRPLPEFLEQVEKNKKDIEDHETRISNIEAGGSGSGSGSGVPTYQVIGTDGFVTEVGGGYAVDVSEGPLKIKLPLNPKPGDVVYIKDYDGSCSIEKTITVETLDKIHGVDTSLILDRKNVSLVVSYIDTTQGWSVVDGIGVDGDYGSLEKRIDDLTAADVGAMASNVRRVGNQDWDSFTTAGSYPVINFSGPNGPSVEGHPKVYTYGTLFVQRSELTISQMYITDQNKMYLRDKFDENDWGIWTPVASDESVHIYAPADLDDFSVGGTYNLYRKTSSDIFANAPDDFYYGTLQVIGRGKLYHSFVTQILTSKDGGGQWIRTRNDGDYSWYSWKKIYSEAFKPTAADVGALSVTGGTVSGGMGASYFLPSSTVGSGRGLVAGNGDGATLAINNIKLETWFGFGIWCTQGTPGYSHSFNSRTGALTARGRGDFSDVGIRSDRKMKFGLTEVGDALSKVEKLQAYSFNSSKPSKDSDVVEREVGIIAQDLQSVFPEAVKEEEGGDSLVISVSAVNALLVESIKELNDKIKYLESKINDAGTVAGEE